MFFLLCTRLQDLVVSHLRGMRLMIAAAEESVSQIDGDVVTGEEMFGFSRQWAVYTGTFRRMAHFAPRTPSTLPALPT